MCEELKIAELIDTHLPNNSADKILSTGTGVVSLILNGLGFVNKRLYLVSHFFKNKPIDKLLNVSYLESSHLNDDALGRCLDDLYDFGVSKLYSLISSHAIGYLSANHGLEVSSGQLDNTTFHLHGKEKSLMLEDGRLLEIVKGYSKDHRPDLVQIGLQLIVENQSRIPLLMEILSGNQEEGKSYGDFITTYAGQLEKKYGVELVVVDSKLYNRANLEILSTKGSLKWITRVPNHLKAVKELISTIDKDSLKPLNGYEGYQYQVVYNNYGSVAQRWLVLHSEGKYLRDLKGLHKRLLKETQLAQKALKKLGKQSFDSEKGAFEAANLFSSKLKYSNLEQVSVYSKKHYKTAGKPKKGQQADSISYHIEAMISSDLKQYEIEKEKLGFFILATNELDEVKISDEELLEHYKNQSSVERSFRFLKDPNIVASSLFVQKPERMTAILMVMTLCLLVYSALEYTTRKLLKKNDLTFPNQQGKLVQNPTMKWIFEYFEGIHILYTPDNQTITLNMNEHQKILLKLLGRNFQSFYS
jgi:transposase